LGWQDGYRYGSLEVARGRECRQLSVLRDGSFTSVPAFSADGRVLAAGTEYRTHFWAAASGKEIGAIQYKHADDIIFNPDGRSFITVDRDDGVRQRTWEHVGGGSSSVYRLGRPRSFFDAQFMEAVSMSLDGRYLGVTQTIKGEADIFDLQNPGVKRVLAGQPMVNRIAISPDGRWVATASWHNSLLRIWDARSGDLVRSASLPDRASVAFSPDGHWLAISSANFQLWQVGTWQLQGPPEPAVDEPVENFSAFSPDSRMIARSKGHEIELLDVSTGKALATLESPGSSYVTRFQFSPDGTQLAVAQFDQQVRLWDLRLIREELAQMNLDWDLPPYPPASKTTADVPVTLEVEPDSPAPALTDTSTAAH
jgi:WD40 repeat protein